MSDKAVSYYFASSLTLTHVTGDYRSVSALLIAWWGLGGKETSRRRGHVFRQFENFKNFFSSLP